jgi:transcription elongation factor S-II
MKMSSRDMATDEQKDRWGLASREDVEATRTDYLRENIARIEKENGIEHAVSQFGPCKKCGGSKTTHYQLQMRSSDEPMTVFVTCITCGNRWKKN